MTKTTFDLSRPLPQPVERRPKDTSIHGITLVDDYAWLRADNWQEVLRDQEVLDGAGNLTLDLLAVGDDKGRVHIRYCYSLWRTA